MRARNGTGGEDGGGDGGGAGGDTARARDRWTEAEFRRLRAAADPEIDAMVARYRRDRPETAADPGGLVRALIRDLGRAKARARGTAVAAPAPDDPVELLDDLAAATGLPEWGHDAALIERGQRVFTEYGLYQSVALFFSCLPLAYAAPESARALARVSDLATGNLTRRVAETGQMLIDVMGLEEAGALEPGGRGHTAAIGLRLLHSCVRALLLERDGPDGWDTETQGPPVNQELLLATLMDFSLVTWEAMERMGVVLGDADRAANLYAWSVFGHLMGVDACEDGPLTLADIGAISEHLGRGLAPTPEGRRLMAALLAEMEEFMPMGWRKLPRSLIHWLFAEAGPGVGEVPKMLGVPPPAWWARPMFATALAAHRVSWLPDPLRPVVRGLIRRAGRLVILTYADRYSGGGAPFQIPDELARRWRPRVRAAA
ncbi:oxygenase MpaB family protein, partial [Spirillospora sp. NPDC029432]|uniref:oxygenase MpaB family protein n=1 Tax=Spirillospora sp. NPDC029432 TaxID=3154599 RepID=UPI003452DAC6